MLNHEEVDFLYKALPFFQKLDRNDQDMIAMTAFCSMYSSGDIIFSKERECEGLIIIKSGQLRALYGLEDGKEITLYRLMPRDICILTASCVLKNISFEIILEVEKNSEVFFIPPAIWRKLSEKSVAVKDFSIALISERLSEIIWVMDQMISKNMEQRIASFLLEQSSLEHSEVLSVTHDTIARNVGTVREAISRSLKYMENAGLLKLSRGQIRLTNMKKLKEIGH
jgi:CRP/FNR family transcriptional regulator